ncbi:monoheme cytochrome C [Flavivirga sp. 57AJ16]|uniref:monoheme cytochrome C n=1 Tax=Flavivirga sp. 57AJ16 TaxID=3025307 RepID=UPI00308247B2
MENQGFKNKVKRIYYGLTLFFGLLLILSGGLVYKMVDPSFLTFPNEVETETYVDVVGFDNIENGIHLETGFKDDEGLQTVIVNCTSCHSAKLVTQNRANKEGWISIIRWMQETQNLWDLGTNEVVIVNYLAKNYGIEEKGRRDNLENVEWYDLKN